MRLPFAPESPAQLQARLWQALAPVYDPDLCAHGLQATPSVQRRHVLDSADGLRLIVSRDLLDGRAVLHLSASAEPGTPLYLELVDRLRRRGDRPTRRWFVRLAEQRWRDLCGTPVVLHTFSPGTGVPHWFGERLDA